MIPDSAAKNSSAAASSPAKTSIHVAATKKPIRAKIVAAAKGRSSLPRVLCHAAAAHAAPTTAAT